MKIDTTKESNVLTIVLEGSLDTVTAPDLEADLKKNLDGVTKLILDFAGVPFISSAGIRVILWAYKAMPSTGRKVVLKNASDDVKEVFALTGIDKLLTFE